MVDRLDTMTESQVVDGISQVRAARQTWNEEITERIGEMIHAEPPERSKVAVGMPYTREETEFLISFQTFFNSVNKLRLRVGAKVPLGGPGFDLLEDALNERLKSLREGPSGDS